MIKDYMIARVIHILLQFASGKIETG